MPPWPLTQHDPTQLMIVSPCCGEESEVWFNYHKSNIWWMFLLHTDVFFQDLFAFPPVDELEIPYDYWEWADA